MPHPTLWLTRSALEDMIAEAQRALPNETGGMLLGWEHDERNEIVVASAIGPGPTAAHAPNGFRPDGAWHQTELSERYERSHGRITYLGDWHVHPRGGFGMSRRDRRTLSRIARCSEARCPHPLMGLVAPNDGDYRVGVWRWRPHWIPLRYGNVTALDVRTWTPTEEETSWLG